MILSNESFWHVLFHARVNEKRVPDQLRFAFWNEMIKLRRQFVQNDDTHTKKKKKKKKKCFKTYNGY